MRSNVTVVPNDGIIVVDGYPLRFSFPAQENLNALQWHDGSGHMEWADDINHPLTEADYASDVQPYVTLWENEKARLDAAEAAEKAAQIAKYNSTEERAKRVRAERDARLAETDYLVMPDYPIEAAYKAAVLAYRQALRDMPEQDGFPWLGGGSDDQTCPWPVKPVRG